MDLIKRKDDSGIGYLRLNSRPEAKLSRDVVKQLKIEELLIGYKGPDMILDFSKQGELIGIEIFGKTG